MERFTPSSDGSRLDYRAIVTDPSVLPEPIQSEKFWLYVPNGTECPSHHRRRYGRGDPGFLWFGGKPTHHGRARRAGQRRCALHQCLVAARLLAHARDGDHGPLRIPDRYRPPQRPALLRRLRGVRVIRRGAGTGRAGKQPPTVGQRDVPAVRTLRAVPRPISLDDDLRPGLD